MKKVIVVNASPRKGGNSDVITEKLSAEIPDAAIETFYLRNKVVHPCRACNACKSKDTPFCIQKDDMAALIDKLDVCDAFVLVSPIYFGQMNGPAKNFIDRLYCFFNPSKQQGSVTTKSGKKAAFICPCGMGPVDVYTKYAQDTAGCFAVVGADQTRVFVCGNVNEPGSCATNSAYMNEIHAIATWLSE